MADNKKSFILYCDLIHTVNHLDNDYAGKLFKHILMYVNDENPETNDMVVNLAFEPIKQQLKRDLVKFEERAERSRANGSKGGRPKKPKKPSRLNKNLKEPKKPDNVNDNDNDNDNDNVNDNKKEILNKWLNYRTEIKKPINVKSTLDSLILRFNKEDLEKVNYVVNLSIENNWQGLFWDKYPLEQKEQQKGGYRI